jgi:hypothetical protein
VSVRRNFLENPALTGDILSKYIDDLRILRDDISWSLRFFDILRPLLLLKLNVEPLLGFRFSAAFQAARTV